MANGSLLRSMREDPQPDKPAAEKLFHGDNFVRKGGEYAAWQNLTLHSITAHEKGLDVQMQANPSLAEMLYKQFKEKKEQLEVSTGWKCHNGWSNVSLISHGGKRAEASLCG